MRVNLKVICNSTQKPIKSEPWWIHYQPYRQVEEQAEMSSLPTDRATGGGSVVLEKEEVTGRHRWKFFYATKNFPYRAAQTSEFPL